MFIAVAGFSHAASPVDLRERVSYTAETRSAALAVLRSFYAEAVILDTCNRSEIYVASLERDVLAPALRRFLSSFHHIASEEFEPHLYIHLDCAAAA